MTEMRNSFAKQVTVAPDAYDQTLLSVLETSLDAVVMIRPDGVIIGWCKQAEISFGWSADEALGCQLSELLIPERYRAGHKSGMRRFAQSGQATIVGKRLEVGALHKDGHEVPVELAVMQSSSKGSEIFVGFLRDLSERYAADEKISVLQESLIYVARQNAMGTMGSMLAHELNQPLTAASNYYSAASKILSRLPDSPVVEEARSAMGLGMAAITRAGETIREIRAMIDRRGNSEQEEDVVELVNASLRLLVGTIASLPQTDIAEDARFIIGNKVQIEQVLINLVRNADEATAGQKFPQVVVSTRASGNTVIVCVSDNGPGVSPSQVEHLFSPSVSDKEGGLGLGLSISRTIVEQHGGRIWTDRRNGKTLFCFSLRRGHDA